MRMLALLCLSVGASAAAAPAGPAEPAEPSPCQPLSLAVDGHRVRRAMAAEQRPVFSWQLPTTMATGGHGSGAACGRQAAYQVHITDGAGAVLYDSGRANASASDGVRLPPPGTPPLPPMRELAFIVRVWAGSSAAAKTSAWSLPCPFATRIPSADLSAVRPLWAAPPPPATLAAAAPAAPARFAMLRGAFDCSWAGSTFLALSAKPAPNWKADPPRGNASKLLGAYKAWLNGVPLGVGPGRTYAQGVGVDVYNVTTLLRCEARDDSRSNVLAVQAFYQPLGWPGPPNNTDDAGGVWAALFDGGATSSLRFSTGPAHLKQWSAFHDADAAFGIGGAPGCTKKMCAGDVAQRYFQPAENIDMARYPDGWQQPQRGSRPDLWRPAVQRAAGAFADGLTIKAPMPLTLRRQLPLRFLNVSSTGDRSWRYIVDFGCNHMGGLNVSFGAPAWAAGRVVQVRTGETLCPNGSVAYYVSRTKVHGGPSMGVDHICQKGLRHEDVLNNWTSHWVLRGGDGTGRQRVETHEYVVMRYAEIIGAPEAPTAEHVRGWAVQYPFDGRTAESGEGAPIDAECTARRSEGEPAAAALTEFQSSSPTLNAVWRLCRYTVLVGALDSNTDSNTRQRDLCNLDAMLASRYQGAVAAQAAEHPRRQVAATLSTPQAYTNNHTLEFNMAAVAAVFFHAIELGDMSVAENRFEETQA